MPSIKVGFRSRPNGHACIDPTEAAATALCFGWGPARKSVIDSSTYCVTFKPILPNARWSAEDLALAEDLHAQGRMTPAGRWALQSRAQANGISAPSAGELPQTMLAELKRHPHAWAQFSRMSPSHRQKWTDWVLAAKHEETRARRFGKLLLDLGKLR
jgi:uncharacterized protein YdeI (YjbR/CyaY-like superfamily)